MELRHVVEHVVALDDERKAVSNGINRAVDALERSLGDSSRVGLSREQLAGLRERLAYGSAETTALARLADAVRDALVDDTVADAERVAAAFRPGDAPLAAEELRHRLRRRVESAREAFGHVGRLEALLARRAEIESRLAAVRERAGADPLDGELLDIAVSAREAALDRESLDAAAFLDAALAEASADPGLTQVAEGVAALERQVADGEAGPRGDEVARAVVEAAVHLAQEREALRRQLAQQAREVERRQDLSHEFFELATKASEVLERVGTLEKAARGGTLVLEDLAGLRAPCLEHGILSLRSSLRSVRMEHRELDAAVRDLSGALGELFTLCARDRACVEALAPAWDEIAASDPRTIEADWETTVAQVLGIRKEGGVLSVSHDHVGGLAAAGGIKAWQDVLLQAVDSRRDHAIRLIGRLEEVDRVLTSLRALGDPVGPAADRVKAHLATFTGETLHAVGVYYDRVRDLLLDPERGVALVISRVGAFEQGAAAGSSPAQVLQELGRAFGELESRAMTDMSPEEVRVAEDRLSRETASGQRRLAAVLARSKRLQSFVLRPLPADAVLARHLASCLRTASSALQAATEQGGDLSPALEALDREIRFLEALALPMADVKGLGALARRRNRLLLDLRGDALTLLFRLLAVLGHEMEVLPETEKAARAAWIDELLAHARKQTVAHLRLLDATLFELEDNAARLARFLDVFDAYRGWAQGVSSAEWGMALIERDGKALFADFEESLSTFGSGALASLSGGAPDWRTSSSLESLIELLTMAAARLEGRPTLTDIAARLTALKDEAGRARDRLLERAEHDGEPFTSSGGLIFR